MANAITIHRALTKLKTNEARIDRLIDTSYIRTVRASDKDSDSMQKQGKLMIADADQLIDLLAEQEKIKTKIAISNAETTVEIAGRRMTVTEAINYKFLLETKQGLVKAIEGAVREAQAVVARSNAGVEDAIAMNVGTLFKDGANDSNKLKLIEEYTKQELDRCTLEIFDPAGMGEYAQKLKTEIEDFSEEVDAVLSESNALTKIWI